MRLSLLLLAFGALSAAEPIPVLDLDYEADGPTPPAPIAAWWNAAVAGAAAWTSQHAGVAVAPAAIANVTSLRLVGAALPSADGDLEPWAAGWVDGLDEAGGQAVAALAARWPGYALRHDQDGRTIIDAAGLVPPHRVTLPGWRLTLHGAALAAALGNELPLPKEIDAATQARIHDLLAGWDLTAITAAAGAFVETGLPARWFTAPDPRIAARLPAGAAVSAVLAIDGNALADDAEALFPPGKLPFFLEELKEVPGVSLRGLASALTGTWAGWWNGAEEGLVCMPRSQVGDGLLRLMASEEKLVLPTDENVVRMGPGVFAACTAESWIFATDEAMIAAWRAVPAATPAVVAGEARISAAALAALLAELPLEAVAQLPLADAVHAGGNGRIDALANGLGLQIPAPTWRDDCRGLACLDASSVRFIPHEGALRLELGGPVLPWLLPGLGLRWFTDQAEDLTGRDLLRRTIARLRGEGAGALPEDLLAGLPPLDDQLEAATQVAAVVQKTLSRVRGGSWWLQARSEGVPLAIDSDDSHLAALLAVVAASAPMDAPDFPPASTVMLRQAERDGTLGPAMPMTQGSLGREMVSAARDLAAIGRPEALVLLARAQRFDAKPTSLMQAYMTLAKASIIDDIYLALGVGGGIPPARLDVWLSAPAADMAWAVCWRGERLCSLGWVASAWLGMPLGKQGKLTGLDFGMGRHRFGPSPFAPHVLRATVAEDIARLMDVERGLECGRPLTDLAFIPRSAPGMMLMPALTGFNTWQTERTMRHALNGCAWRIHRLGLAGGLPADEAAVAAQAGPLTVPWGATQLPLRYQRLPAGGFTLFLDPAAPMPAGVRPDQWKRWTAAARPPREGSVECFAIQPDGRCAVIIDPHAKVKAKPADDF